MEAITMFVISILGMVLTNNLVMSVVKYLLTAQKSKLWLRGVLTAISALGVIATASLTGNAIDFNSLSSLGTALAEIVGLAVASHFSYTAIKSA